MKAEEREIQTFLAHKVFSQPVGWTVSVQLLKDMNFLNLMEALKLVDNVPFQSSKPTLETQKPGVALGLPSQEFWDKTVGFKVWEAFVMTPSFRHTRKQPSPASL